MNSGFFRITKDHLTGEYDGKMWHIIDADQYGDVAQFYENTGKGHKLTNPMPVKVRLYDDDDILYYDGDTESEELLMAIFVYFKSDSGTTRLDAKIPKAKWERWT